MTDQPLPFVLRDLPGVAPLNEELSRPNFHWSKERDDFDQRCSAVSLALFGISEADTEMDYPVEPYFSKWGPEDDEDVQDLAAFEEKLQAYERWEENFILADCSFDEARPVYEMFGWDVTDGADSQLPILSYFSRQIIATTKGLVGRPPDAAIKQQALALLEFQEATVAAEEWGESLADQAERFARERRRARDGR